MSDRLVDFVKAGQAAQAAVDKITGRHVDRLLPQIALDAAAVSSQLLEVSRHLVEAAAHRQARRHTNAATCEKRARQELKQLGLMLEFHFRRFVLAVSYRCTCGWELAGAGLEAYLEKSGTHTPASIACQHCGGVAVRMTG